MDFCKVVLIFSATLCCLHGTYGAGSSWGYFGVDGEANWTTIESKCGGERQSPIDIDTSSAEYVDYAAFSLTGFDVTAGVSMNILNNGHTAKLSPIGVTPIVSGGGLPADYKVKQIHFHWGKTSAEGSEHLVNGIKFPMEMHIVTYKSSYPDLNSDALADGEGLAVLGFFFEVGNVTHPGIQKVVDSLSSITTYNTSVNMASALRIDELMPSSFPTFYRYLGSLTTPTCNEAVVWTVFSNTVKVTEAQLNAFRVLQMAEKNDDGNYNMYNNYRTPQNLNKRKVSTNDNSNSAGRPSVTSALLTLPIMTMLLKLVM